MRTVCKRFRVVLATAVALAASLGVGSLAASAASGTIDQVGLPNPPSGIAPQALYTFQPVGDVRAGEDSVGERITPTRSGQLTAMWFAGACNGCADILTMQVRADSGGGSAGPLLGSTTVLETAWPSGDLGGFVRVPLNVPVSVTAGQSYFVYLSHRTHETASVFHIDAWPGSVLPVGSGSLGFVYYSPTEWTAGQYLVFESEIDSAAPPQRTINDTDPGLRYGGSGWFYDGGRPDVIADVANDVHATVTDGDWVSYTFNGTGIAYVSEKSDGYGLVDVYLDGQFQQTVDANAPGVHNLGGQVLFSETGLTAGQHTLKLVKRSGVYMLLDALVVTS